MTTLTDTQVITASGGLVELGYSQVAANINSFGTTAAAATTVVSPMTVVCDGSPVLVEFFSCEARPSNTLNDWMIISLYQDGTEAYRQWMYFHNTGSSFDSKPIHLTARLTPSAGSHTFGVKAYTSSGSGTINSNLTGVTGSAPAFLRVSKIVQATQWPAVTTGTIICTSSTRPGSPFEGQTIYETDTKKELTYTGAAWTESKQFRTVGGSVVDNYRVPPIARAYRSTDLGPSPAYYVSNAAINFDASDIDTDASPTAVFAAGTTPLTIRTTGYYLVEFNAVWSATATVTLYVPKILINGTSAARAYRAAAATTAGYEVVSTMLKLNAGDTVGAAIQFAGGSNYIINGGASVQTDGVSRLSVAWLGQVS